MEKLIYVLGEGELDVSEAPARFAEAIVPAARAVGGEKMAVLVPDLTEEVRSGNAMRIGGDFDAVSAVFECWVPALDFRGPIEDELRAACGSLWGYLVTESTLAPCPHTCDEGGRVPGVTQWGMNDKPAQVELDDFLREWQEVHSKLSFELHPSRDSYIRNMVARKLTAEAPTYLAIVLERFPSLDDFIEDARYFGDPAVVTEMIEHLPKFYEFQGAITGGMSEFRFA